jgi:hypothetical protein
VVRLGEGARRQGRDDRLLDEKPLAHPFANAILARRSDLLNTYLSPNGMGGVHPSDNVALALTLADWRRMSGKELLATVYMAFYFAAAFATYYDPETGGYDHDAAATFFTALTVGRVLGLSEEQLILAQRIAGMFGLDINQAGVGQMTDWKHCTYASCALRGFQAVRVALAGFQAPFEIYEGAAGVDKFFPHAEAVFDPPPDLSRIIFIRKDLSRPFEVRHRADPRRRLDGAGRARLPQKEIPPTRSPTVRSRPSSPSTSSRRTPTSWATSPAACGNLKSRRTWTGWSRRSRSA